MKVFELAKELKIKSKALLNEIDDPRVTGHMSKVPESIVAELLGEEKKTQEAPAEPEAVVDSTETVSIEAPIVAPEPVVEAKPVEVCPVDLVALKGSINGLGGKSPLYKWKYLLDA
jgi:hypothetical protein